MLEMPVHVWDTSSADRCKPDILGPGIGHPDPDLLAALVLFGCGEVLVRYFSQHRANIHLQPTS